MKLKFTKMQGAGNDFVVLDNLNDYFTESALKKMTPELTDRRFGIGADGLIAINSHTDHAYEMLYLNADGSNAGMCGNGGRCAALYASAVLKFSLKHSFSVNDQVYTAEVAENDMIRLHMPAKPAIKAHNDVDLNVIYEINTGTEHICIVVEKLDDPNRFRALGKKLRFDKRFAPKGTNVNFIERISDDILSILTYERGVEDLTLACGTGAVASAICNYHLGGKSQVTVQCPGGDLMAGFEPDSTTGTFINLTLAGPASIVFHGEIDV